MSVKKKITLSLDTEQIHNAPYALAIGMFDGLHKGHARVIAKCIQLAKKYGAKPAILTFYPHPSTVVKMPHPPVKMLFDTNQRAEMFAEAGAQKVFLKKFDTDFAALSANKFADILSEKFPKLKAVITGENFLFGKNAEGNADTLRKICKERGWEYAAVARIKSGDKRISSTRLRNALEKGDMLLYKKLAGNFYQIRGKVQGGRHIGRTLGFPTLNIAWNPDCKPPFGAYVAQIENSEGKIYNAVASYGTSPSIAEGDVLFEAHILGTCDLKNDSILKARLLKFLRPQEKFNSVEALKIQIAKDKIAAEKFFNKLKIKENSKKMKEPANSDKI